MSGPAYGSADTVRAMLGDRDGVTDELITEAATKLGWPTKDPHPFLVAEGVEKKLRRG